jgi:flagellar biosynthesis component FlhA
MTPITTIKEKKEEKILKVKQMVEELELQLALGKADLLDEVENQKKNLNDYITNLKEELNKAEYKGNTDKVKAIFEEVQLQLALGKAESRDAIAGQKENLFKSIKKLENFFSQDTDEIFSGLAENFNFTHENLSYLIIMGSRGLGAVKSFLIGSESNYVLHNAKCPVMIIH